MAGPLSALLAERYGRRPPEVSPEEGEQRVARIEARYGVSLPEDFADHVRTFASDADWEDDRYFTWWGAGRIRSLAEECPEVPGPDQLNPPIQAEAVHYIVFADYLYWCYAYAICCGPGENRGRVALVGGLPDRFVAGSFTGFVERVLRDDRGVHAA